jgi:hypothetical protein
MVEETSTATRGSRFRKKVVAKKAETEQKRESVSSWVYVGRVLPCILMGGKKSLLPDSVPETLSGTSLISPTSDVPHMVLAQNPASVAYSPIIQGQPSIRTGAC